MVNINGLDVVNGENYPLDIWSLYMRNAVQKYPVEQFDAPSQDLNLEVKTDGRTYVKPPPPPKPPEKTKEEKSGDEKKKEPSSGDAAAQPEEPNPPETRQTPSATGPDQKQPARQTPTDPPASSASPAPSSASPAPDGG